MHHIIRQTRQKRLCDSKDKSAFRLLAAHLGHGPFPELVDVGHWQSRFGQGVEDEGSKEAS